MNFKESVAKICKKHHYNGSILISKKNTILLQAGYGYADIEKKVAIQPHTKIRIASISKQITAFAILQLVNNKLINVQDSIEKFFPDYHSASKITIHHLLSNTSGIPNFDIFGDYEALYKKDDFYDAFIKQVIYPMPLGFEPGNKFEYSGSGYLILTSIIEKVSGLPYDKYILENIFKPLEMNDSGFDFGDDSITNMAIPYDYKDNEYVPALNIDLRLGGGGGGLYSTVVDLFKWNQGLMNHVLLQKENIDKIFTNHIQIIEDTGYGYGMFLEVSEVYGELRKVFYHTGGGPGVQAINVFFMDDQLTLTMLSNVNDKTQFHNTRTELYQLLLEK